MTLTVSVDGTTGEPVTVEYEAAVSSIPAALVANGDRTVLEVGPVLDQLGAVVSDGIPVTVSVDGRPTPIEVPLRGGSASIDLGVIDTTATVEVDVLGVLETVTP